MTALAPAVGSLVLALVLGHAMFLLVGLLGPVTLLATSGTDRDRRPGRAARTTLPPELRGQRPTRRQPWDDDRHARQLVVVPPAELLTSALASAHGAGPRPGTLVPEDSPGSHRSPTTTGPPLDDGALAIVGPAAVAAAHAVVAHLVGAGWPVTLMGDGSGWSWLAYVGGTRVHALPPPATRVLVVDRDPRLARSAALARQRLAPVPTSSVLLVLDDPSQVPVWCRATLTATEGRWTLRTAEGATHEIRAHTPDTAWAEAVARAVAAASHRGLGPVTVGRGLAAPPSTRSQRPTSCHDGPRSTSTTAGSTPSCPSPTSSTHRPPRTYGGSRHGGTRDAPSPPGCPRRSDGRPTAPSTSISPGARTR
ncbi:hypothetical protein [Paraoerskovia sediminicola]|uniref:hypothetical protein n=1 Tax=Paraoerskovia sediminicola TaxID=1138587 RepID=UPI0025729EF0|nr:hypothetical protein [Paraoerskovia sediminicola]